MILKVDVMIINKWTIDDFKKYVHQCIDKHYYIKASAIVSNSFYVGEVEKPAYINVSLFEWLHAVTRQEMASYKATIPCKDKKERFLIEGFFIEMCIDDFNVYTEAELSKILPQPSMS